MSLFDLLGVALAIYTALSVARGHVFARAGLWGRSVMRTEEPQQFWMIIVVYAGLSLALIFVF